MVSARFYPVVGGAERQAYKLAKALTERGISVSVVTGQTRSLVPIRELVDGISVTRLFAYHFYLAGLMSWLWYHQDQYDLIHVHQVVYPAWAAGRIGKWVKKPVIAKAGSSGPLFDLRELESLPILGSAMARAMPRLLDRVIAISEAVVHDLDASGFTEHQIVQIPNGVELGPSVTHEMRCHARQQLRLPNDVPILVYVGRLHPNKNPKMLLDVARILKQRDRQLQLYIVGGRPDHGELVARVRSENLVGTVHLVGESDQVALWLQAADVFVMSSVTEGMSNALIEAMAHGLPVVVTDVGGNKDVVSENVNGYLVPLHDVTQFANRLEVLLGDSNLRQRMGAEGRQMVESRYAISQVAAQYETLYEELLNRPGHKGTDVV